MSDASKLATLLDNEGYDDILDFFDDRGLDSLCPAICMNAGCDLTAEMEGDQDQGWCETCGTGSMKSLMILAGVI